MEIITIVSDRGNWIVEDGIAKGSRLYWRSPRLNVYVKGAMPVKEYGRVANIAMNHLMSIGGKAIELRRYVK